jgi:PhnB protein
MSVHTVAHLNFHGEAREALDFYASVFGGAATIATYADLGMPVEAPGADRVVFGQVVADNGFRVMAYDVPAQAGPAPVAAGTTRRENGVTLTTEPFFLSVHGETVDEVAALWDGLGAGATVVEPFGPAQWAPAFGMLTDRFGVTWILDVTVSHSGA